MGVMISDLSGAESLSPDDLFEIEKKVSNESNSVSVKQLADYMKNTSNGGFKGATNKSLDEFTVSDVGFYFWSGSNGPDGCPMGILEVYSVYSPDDYENTAFKEDDSTYNVGVLLMRLSYGASCYQRMRGMGSDNWSEWGGLKNENGCIIKYGTNEDKSLTVYFDKDTKASVFAEPPSVTVTPIGSGVSELYLVNVETVTTSYFTVRMFTAPLVQRVITATSETVVKEDGSGTKTTTTKEGTTTTDGSISVADGDAFDFFWQAVSDVPLNPWKAT